MKFGDLQLLNVARRACSIAHSLVAPETPFVREALENADRCLKNLDVPSAQRALYVAQTAANDAGLLYEDSDKKRRTAFGSAIIDVRTAVRAILATGFTDEATRLLSLKEQIEIANRELSRAAGHLSDLRAQCAAAGHGETLVSPYGPRCSTCQHTYGWPCDKSPTKICEAEDNTRWGEWQACTYCRKPMYGPIRAEQQALE